MGETIMLINKFNLLDKVRFSCGNVPGDVFTYITGTGTITGLRKENCCDIIYNILCDADASYYESFEDEIKLLDPADGK